MKLSGDDRKALVIGISIALCFIFMLMLLKNSIAVRYMGQHEPAIVLRDGTIVLVCPKCSTVIESAVEEREEEGK